MEQAFYQFTVFLVPNSGDVDKLGPQVTVEMVNEA